MEIVLDPGTLMKQIMLVSTNKDKELLPYYLIAEILLFHVVRQYVSLHGRYNDEIETAFFSFDPKHRDLFNSKQRNRMKFKQQSMAKKKLKKKS